MTVAKVKRAPVFEVVKESDVPPALALKGAAAVKKLMAKNRAIHPSAKVGKGGLKGKYACLCGCGGRTDFTFLRGHVQRVRGWIVRAKAGEGQPTNLGMPLDLARRLGPWRKKGDGLVPSKKYDTLIR